MKINSGTPQTQDSWTWSSLEAGFLGTALTQQENHWEFRFSYRVSQAMTMGKKLLGFFAQNFFLDPAPLLAPVQGRGSGALGRSGPMEAQVRH